MRANDLPYLTQGLGALTAHTLRQPEFRHQDRARDLVLNPAIQNLREPVGVGIDAVHQPWSVGWGVSKSLGKPGHVGIFRLAVDHRVPRVELMCQVSELENETCPRLSLRAQIR